MNPQVDTVAIKLPNFWATNPEAWFVQAEAQFQLRNISQDDTKYYHVVAALDSSTATRALSLLSNPPEKGKYQAIKIFLTTAYGLSDEERASTLFSMQGLAGRKPSELMDTMLGLLGPHRPCFLFKHLFLQQLPDYVRAPLSTLNIEDCRSLALQADKLYLSVAPPSSVVEVNAAETNASKRPDSTQNMCWYHARFGTKAKHCNEPCVHFSSFKRKSNQGNAKGGQQ